MSKGHLTWVLLTTLDQRETRRIKNDTCFTQVQGAVRIRLYKHGTKKEVKL